MRKMKRISPLLFFLSLLLGACKQEPSAFEQWLTNFQAENPLAYFEQSPDSFYVLSPEQLQIEMDKLEEVQSQLLSLKTAILPVSHWEKRKQWMDHVQSIKEKWAPPRKDPSLYNLPGYCKKLLSEDEISLPERLILIKDNLQNSEQYYQAAKQLIQTPLASKTLLGAQKHLLGLHFLSHELVDSLNKAPFVPDLEKAFRSDLAQTRLVVKDYLAFCESLYFDLHDDWGRE